MQIFKVLIDDNFDRLILVVEVDMFTFLNFMHVYQILQHENTDQIMYPTHCKTCLFVPKAEILFHDISHVNSYMNTKYSVLSIT